MQLSSAVAGKQSLQLSFDDVKTQLTEKIRLAESLHLVSRHVAVNSTWNEVFSRLLGFFFCVDCVDMG